MVLSIPLETLELDDIRLWKWKQSSKPVLTNPDEIMSNINTSDPEEGWKDCTQMPSVIHCELIASGEIDDPFLSMNEKNCQWVGERDWIYQCRFKYDKLNKEFTNVDIIFDGLDTYATVYLNGEKVLSSDNMFTSHRIDITTLLASENVMTIVFTSAFIKGRVIEEEHLGSNKHLVAWNGDFSRLFVRKASYHYSWDWGPLLSTCGLWKPIRIESYSARIHEFSAKSAVNDYLQSSLEVSVSTTSKNTSPFARFSIRRPDGSILKSCIVAFSQISSTAEVHWTFEPEEIDLWWSVGRGKQPLYTVKVELLDPSAEFTVDSKEKKIGFRRLRVVQDPLINEKGTSFYFEINNVPIFIGGSNWIPIDSFLTNATPERYRKWLELLISGNQNMIRSWGGGIYENDCFFDLCDELGILVWQDFSFACGQYPAFPEFIKSVKLEAELNVKRIRHHPSIAIFAGNNEDYQVAETIGLDEVNFPARIIYEKILPEIVHRLTDIYYHPGSPYGGETTRDPTVGDIHQWNVWHGTQEPYQNWDKLGGRFISEFGMQGFPIIQTIDYFLDGDTNQRYPQSEVMQFHNKATGAERRLELYLIENIRYSFEMESYLYGTQFIQAEALSTAYRVWRRRFQGPGKNYVGGALVWQLNDVFPCISWSIVDYFLNPKPAYYAIKQALSVVSVGIKRFTQRKYKPNRSALYSEMEVVEIWVSNSDLIERNIHIILEAFNLSTGEVVYSELWSRKIEGNQSTELRRLKVPIIETKAPIVVCVRILDPNSKQVLSRFSAFPEPYKFLIFPSKDETALMVKFNHSKESMTIQSQRPVKGLILSFDPIIESIEDNCLDLIPGEKRVIKVVGISEETKIKWRHLGGHGEGVRL